MKKNIFAWALILGCTLVFNAPAYAGSNGCLTLDGIYSHRLSGVIGHDNGLGGSLMVEWQPIEYLSVGAGMETFLFFGVQTPGISAIESVNLVGRYIFNPGESWTFYFLVAGGLNPKIDIKSDVLWGGDFHVMGGPGAWYFISPGMAIDMGLVFDYYNNTAPIDPLNAFNVRAGLSFFFEDTKKQASAAAQATPTPQAAVPTQTVVEAAPVSAVATPTSAVQASVATPALSTSNGPAAKVEAAASAVKAEAETASREMASILSFKGDSLWDTAARTDVYGDPELYPLLVDANREVLKPKQFVLNPDTKLVVPKDPTQDMINKARKDAWTAKYQQFSGRRLSPEGYKKWRETHGLSAPAN
jgi:hypothetical protein